MGDAGRAHMHAAPEKHATGTDLEGPARDGESPVLEACVLACASPRVPRDTSNLVGSWEAHLPRLHTTTRPIVNQYREGTVKRTPVKGVKETLNPYVYKRSEQRASGAMACLLHNEPASSRWQRG